MSTTTITRRAALTGTAAATAALATGPAMASAHHSDAELQRLWGEFVAQQNRYNAARAAHDPVRDAFDAACPPSTSTWFGGDRWRDLQPLWRSFDLDRLTDAWNDEHDKVVALIQTIHATPAEGVYGIGIKLAARHRDWQEEDSEEALVAVLEDVKRLTGGDILPEWMDNEKAAAAGAVYVLGYEAVRMTVRAAVDAETGRAVGIHTTLPIPPHNDDERKQYRSLSEKVLADPEADRKMAAFCIKSGRCYDALRRGTGGAS